MLRNKVANKDLSGNSETKITENTKRIMPGCIHTSIADVSNGEDDYEADGAVVLAASCCMF